MSFLSCARATTEVINSNRDVGSGNERFTPSHDSRLGSNLPSAVTRHRQFCHVRHQFSRLRRDRLVRLLRQMHRTQGIRGQRQEWRVGRHLFFVGGRVKTEPDWTLLYCLDLERMWWFVFFVTPDGDSVTMADGLVRNGCFLLPRIHSFGLAYSHEKRAIVAFLGCPYTDPPTLFLVSIGEAMGVINLRDDLRAMLSF